MIKNIYLERDFLILVYFTNFRRKVFSKLESDENIQNTK